MSNENKIKLLWDCAKSLTKEQQTHKLLKSYYINTCRKLSKNNLQIPKEKFSSSQMCQYCGSFWMENEFELKSIPKHLQLSSREMRLVENFEKNDGTGKTLNRSQKNRAKWLIKKSCTRLLVKCQQCNHKSFLNIEKEKNKSTTQSSKNKEAEENTIVSKNNNKLHQKGLSLGAFKKKHGKSSLSLPSKSHKTKIEEQKVSTGKTKTAKQISSNKTISNTQKQNSILQLAALLKKQHSNVDAKKSAQMKLQTLLK